MFARSPVATKYKIVFFRLGGIGIVDNDPTGETDSRCRFTDQNSLFCCFRIKLQDCTPTFLQNTVQAREEADQPSFGNLSRTVAVTQPLQSRDGDASIERSWTERKPCSHIMVHQITRGRMVLRPSLFIVVTVIFIHSFVVVTVTVITIVVVVVDLKGFFHTFMSDTKHVTRHVTTDPNMALLFKDGPTKATTASNVQDQCRLVWREQQKFDGTECNLTLYIDHPRGRVILPCLLLIVERRCVSCKFWTRHDISFVGVFQVVKYSTMCYGILSEPL
mmetsp:Transcript_44452/g.107552  ORF Transcript_44452/g.107552 Transcript_44452/m.107552 type:complete len:276 (+) Transcript_44452:668-1495(+)